jgi:hypothetical protein
MQYTKYNVTKNEEHSEGCQKDEWNVYKQTSVLGPKRQNELYQPGIEPGALAWQARILPLNH